LFVLIFIISLGQVVRSFACLFTKYFLPEATCVREVDLENTKLALLAGSVGESTNDSIYQVFSSRLVGRRYLDLAEEGFPLTSTRSKKEFHFIRVRRSLVL